MKTNEDSPRSLDDVIFENRNHDYGAYVIRRTYPDNVNKGAMMALSVVAVVAIISMLPKEITPDIVRMNSDKGQITLQDLPLIPHPKPPSHPIQVQRGTPNLTPRPTTAEVVETAMTPVDALVIGPADGADVGATDQLGAVPAIPEEIGPSFTVEEKVWDHTEVMPEYVGGLNAMVHFISKNVKYPSRARRMNIQGTVFVSFVIGKDGSVIDPKIVKGFDIDCENEAMKVMAKMARWNPGLQSGVPVMVRMVIPIKFALSE